MNAEDYPPGEFFTQRLQRLQKNFDLRSYEKSKELLIDAYCEEAINPLDSLKIWKGAAIRSDRAKGNADYLIAKRRDYLEQPYLCVVEAKKDDFAQGLAQCLAEMYACQWQNAAAETAIAVYGIVTNATLWQFYRLDTDGKVYESSPYANSNPAQLLGILHFVFKQCVQP
ncbi:MAG: hypothetical protein AAGA67_13880 [Cyanobacteria bacterium P01_F01_bin.153]